MINEASQGLMLASSAGLQRVMSAGSGAADPDASLGKLFLYVGLALAVSFLCSILEAILLSSSRSHIQVLADQGKRAGRLMLRHKAHVEKPISAILTLNTVAHTAGSVGAGAQAKGLFGQSEAIVAVVLTLLVLVFSEIIPKSLGANYWKQLTPFAAYAIDIMVKLLYPAVWALEQLTRVISPREKTPIVSRIELQAMAALSRSEGSIAEREHRIFSNLLRLDHVRVRDIMTPRIVVTALPERLTVGQVLGRQGPLRYSRIPVYGEDIDDVTGFVLRLDIVNAGARDQHDKVLAQLRRPLHTVPEHMTVARALDEFSSRRDHMFLVVDEYGGTAGILTMEDSIETLLGVEITDESDLVADLRDLARRRYEARLEALKLQVDEDGA
ncbi:MAG: HlyC/CorC family transporter [Chloroflexi bacterium]|nr:HlyC/CorC family transporter [Chloroflexota bacterium]